MKTLTYIIFWLSIIWLLALISCNSGKTQMEFKLRFPIPSNSSQSNNTTNINNYKKFQNNLKNYPKTLTVKNQKNLLNRSNF